MPFVIVRSLTINPIGNFGLCLIFQLIVNTTFIDSEAVRSSPGQLVFN
jgi:hypothetical protein